MASIADITNQDLFVILNCIDTNCTEADEDQGDEIFISTAEIDRWDLPSILNHHTVKIEANRNRLMEHSSYFRVLLSGSFSESSCDTILIHWNVESILGVMRFIFGCSVDITPNNFVPLYEATLFFGVEMLLSKCHIWLTAVTSFSGVQPPQLHLDNVIHIWQFGAEHAFDFILQLCTSYLARNFMWVMSCRSFSNIPQELLVCCVKHPDMTVDSEKDLCDAILIWLAANSEPPQLRSSSRDASTNMLKHIRISILPLWFAAGKRRCSFFSEYAKESIHSILSLARQPSTNALDIFGDGDLSRHKIRLAEYTKKVDLAGCPQMKLELLSLSAIPSLSLLDPMFRNDIKLSSLSIEPFTYEAVQEVDISNCPMIDLEEAVEYFRKSFPSLRLLKAAYFLNFRTRNLLQLVQKCPLLSDIDLTVDISPIIPSQVSIVSSFATLTPEKTTYFRVTAPPLHMSKQQLSNITKLTLEGRTDTTDSDLLIISELCPSLSYLNLRGCISITDAGLMGFLVKCIKLVSLLACHTSFGQSSVRSVCSRPSNISCITMPESEQNFCALANKLQTLHIGGCKGVDEASLCQLMSQAHRMKSLCLRETQLVDSALYIFPGSSLETLDVSDTKVSISALADIVNRNPGLKCLKTRGCKHLLQEETKTGGGELCTSLSLKELYSRLGKSCKLEELTLGWGFSSHSMGALRPSLGTLKSLTVGLGGSLGEDGLKLLSVNCPLLETLILYFQAISDTLVRNIVETLTRLRILALHYCFGEISSFSFNFNMPNLRILKLERVVAWMTNDDLVILVQNCANLIELSLLGCPHLNSEAQDIISSGWPGLVSIHLEDCGQVTAHGVSSLFDCVALEDLLLRHNGPGIERNFITLAASKMPMLRKISLDLCDARDGDYDIPDFSDRYFLSIVKISRCKLQRCGLDLDNLQARTTPVHKETLVLLWDSKRVTKTVVKERL